MAWRHSYTVPSSTVFGKSRERQLWILKLFIRSRSATCNTLDFPSLNPLTSNGPYRGRTAPLTSKVAFYIFIQQI